jgi:hypothetical protein
LCAEGLQTLLAHAAQTKQIQGISIIRGGPILTHLFFADDSVLFCTAKLSDCYAIQEVLHKYEHASGQQINHDKTTLFFSASTSSEIKEEIKAALHLPAIQQYDKYLGLPSLVGRSKHATFAHLKERVWNKIQGWKERLLSQAGREVFIKAIIQAIPTYTMNCFKLPKKLCLELKRLVRNFWWGHKENSRKIHWVKCSSLCQSKSLGGMGFRDLAKFNDALLAKQVWRLVHNKSSLLYKVFKSKFFPRGSIMEARCSASASFAWKSILQARNVIRSGARWRVGNGNTIRIWHDMWLPNPSAGVPVTPPRELPDDACVSVLIKAETGSWDRELIERVFLPSEASLILSMTLSSRAPSDLLVWGGEKSGRYSVRSAYRMLATAEPAGHPGSSTTDHWRTFWKKIWSVKVPFKIRNFLWRVCTNALPTLVNLQRRNIVASAKCCFCLVEEEDLMHALWTCPKLLPLWIHHKLTRKIARCYYQSFLDIFDHLFEIESDAPLAEVAFMLWLVWQRCNRAMYQSELDDLDDIPLRALRLSSEF